MIDMEIGEPAALVADNAMSLLKRFVTGIPRGFVYPGHWACGLDVPAAEKPCKNCFLYPAIWLDAFEWPVASW